MDGRTLVPRRGRLQRLRKPSVRSAHRHEVLTNLPSGRFNTVQRERPEFRTPRGAWNSGLSGFKRISEPQGSGTGACAPQFRDRRFDRPSGAERNRRLHAGSFLPFLKRWGFLPIPVDADSIPFRRERAGAPVILFQARRTSRGRTRRSERPIRSWSLRRS